MSQRIKPTKDQFEDYIRIRDSGITNMFDTNMVIALSRTGLTSAHCFYIMANFGDLKEEYYGID